MMPFPLKSNCAASLPGDGEVPYAMSIRRKFMMKSDHIPFLRVYVHLRYITMPSMMRLFSTSKLPPLFIVMNANPWLYLLIGR
jgi:hypothetical protein